MGVIEESWPRVMVASSILAFARSRKRGCRTDLYVQNLAYTARLPATRRMKDREHKSCCFCGSPFRTVYTCTPVVPGRKKSKTVKEPRATDSD